MQSFYQETDKLVEEYTDSLRTGEVSLSEQEIEMILQFRMSVMERLGTNGSMDTRIAVSKLHTELCEFKQQPLDKDRKTKKKSTRGKKAGASNDG
jgi:hypothetical protein